MGHAAKARHGLCNSAAENQLLGTETGRRGSQECELGTKRQAYVLLYYTAVSLVMDTKLQGALCGKLRYVAVTWCYVVAVIVFLAYILWEKDSARTVS